MYRSELKEHLLEQTPLERKRKELGKEARLDEVISPYYKVLLSKGLQDKNGFFRLPNERNLLRAADHKAGYWDSLVFSPHQSDLWLKRASRYAKEPFIYGDYLGIRYVYSGQDVIYTQSESFKIEANDIVLFNSGFVWSQYLAHDEDIVFTIILNKKYIFENIIRNLTGKNILTQSILDYVFDKKAVSDYIIFHGGQNDRFPSIIEDMVCEYMAPTPYGKLLIASYINIFLAQMADCKTEYSRGFQKPGEIQLAKMLDYIDRNYMNVSLEQLAKEFNYNSKYISRLIKNHTGKNYKDYILERKMSQVCVMLTNTTLPIKDILFKAGITNESYFFLKFKERYGISPKEYRKCFHTDLSNSKTVLL